jgi:hypothetical protein
MVMQAKVQAIAAAQKAGTKTIAEGNAEIRALRDGLNARASQLNRPQFVGKTDDCMMIVMSTRGTGHRVGHHFEDEDYDDDDLVEQVAAQASASVAASSAPTTSIPTGTSGATTVPST